jgi:hypothetical protein
LGGGGAFSVENELARIQGELTALLSYVISTIFSTRVLCFILVDVADTTPRARNLRLCSYNRVEFSLGGTCLRCELNMMAFKMTIAVVMMLMMMVIVIVGCLLRYAPKTSAPDRPQPPARQLQPTYTPKTCLHCASI